MQEGGKLGKKGNVKRVYEWEGSGGQLRGRGRGGSCGNDGVGKEGREGQSATLCSPHTTHTLQLLVTCWLRSPHTSPFSIGFVVPYPTKYILSMVVGGVNRVREIGERGNQRGKETDMGYRKRGPEGVRRRRIFLIIRYTTFGLWKEGIIAD